MQDFLSKAGGKFAAAKEQLRKYRLFAKSKTKEAKNRMVAQMTTAIEDINHKLGKALAFGAEHGRKLRGHAVVARRKLAELHETMGKLVPQIRHWLRAGFVASGKVINLHIPQLYSIVRGKVDKAVEFGLSWGITRLRERLGELGVRNIGLAPRGRAAWEVEGKVKERLIRERAQVEGSIGTIKCSKYGFNRPAARSVAMMGECGQRAALGLNLTKLLRGAAEKRGIALTA